MAPRALVVLVTRSWLVEEYKEVLGRLAERNRLHLLWVRGHTGIRGNEIANMLASLGARSEIVGPEPFVGITRCWSKSIIKEKVTENHSRCWTATSGCSHLIITMHGNLQYHLHKMVFEVEGGCR